MHINEKIGDRIRESRIKKGISSSELASRIGMSKQIVTNWEKGRRTPTIESVVQLSKLLDASVNYLLCIDEHSKQTIFNTPLHNLNNLTSQQEEDQEQIKLPTQFKSETKNNFAVRLIDDSMERLFRKGDIVIFDKELKAFDNSYVLVQIISTNQVLFRKYCIDNTDIDNPVVILKPLNPNYPEIAYNDTSVSILGVCSDELRLIG